MSIAIAGALAAVMTTSAAPTIRDVWVPGLKDLSFTAKVESVNRRELAKIRNDVALSYRVDSIKVWAKEPFRLRLESTVKVPDGDPAKGLVVFNGSRTLQRIAGLPALRDDFAMKPGRRQTIFDFGLVTPALFDGFFTAKFVRTDRRNGAHVFDVTYIPRLDDTTRHRVWIDPEKKFVIRREWYSQLGDNPLLAVFQWDQPKKFGSVWIPTRVTAINAEGKTAGSMRFTDVKVNSGLPESLFQLG